MKINFKNKITCPVEILRKFSFGIAFTYLITILFSLFLPISLFAQQRLTKTLEISASPGTEELDKYVTITAKIDNSSVPKLALKADTIYFYSYPKVEGFDNAAKCSTESPFTGNIWTCSVKFKSSTGGVYKIDANFFDTEKKQKIEASSINIQICKASENLISSRCVKSEKTLECTTGKILNEAKDDCIPSPTNSPTVTLPPGNNNSTESITDTIYKPLAPLPDGSSGGDMLTEINTQEECAFGKYLNIIIKLIIGISAVLAMVMITMGGIEYLTSELSSEKASGKDTIQNAILGLVMVMGAYLILNTINPQLLNVCLDKLPEAKIEIENIEELYGGSYSSTGGAGTSFVGSCKSVTDSNNACNKTKLASSCFGSRAEEASKICNIESGGGRINVKSGSDLLNNGTSPSYSVGLWQINLTVHKIGDLDCPAAFSGPCGKGTATPNKNGPFVGGPKVGNCSQKVINQTLYDKCVLAAQDQIKNTEVACKIYKENGNSFKPWSYTANKCGIPKN